MKYFSAENTINYFTPDLNPAFQVDLEETFTIELKDCYGGQVTSEKVLRPDIDISIMNQATGPVFIRNITKQDVCKVEIKKLELASHGIMMTSNGLGVLGKEISEPTTRLFRVKRNAIHFTESITIPVKPMIGVIGVATENEEIHTAVPGPHGGNLDTKEISEGHSIYFPVFQEGAMLALGDMHASMGDGELNGTGVEIGGEVTLSVSKLENRKIESPIVETEEAFLFLTSAKTLEEAIEKCSRTTVTHLQQQLSLDFQTAYRLLSASCDIKISQVVNQYVTVKIAVPKAVLPELFLQR